MAFYLSCYIYCFYSSCVYAVYYYYLKRTILRIKRSLLIMPKELYNYCVEYEFFSIQYNRANKE